LKEFDNRAKAIRFLWTGNYNKTGNRKPRTPGFWTPERRRWDQRRV